MNAGSRLRSATLIYGVGTFLWLSPEDNQVWTVTLLGMTGALIGCAHLRIRLLHDWPQTGFKMLLTNMLLGSLAGLGTTVATIGLMLLKTSLHLHVYPDYPAGVMLGILERAPAWSTAGALVGLGWTLVCAAIYSSEGRRPRPRNPLRSPDGS